MRGLFITGTGTGVGKTLVTCALAHQIHGGGMRVRALKPVVSGFTWEDERSDPALLLQAQGMTATRDAVTAISPWRFAVPLSPHIAAREEKRIVPAAAEVAEWCRAQTTAEECTLVEGAGGVMTPLNDRETMLDLATALQCPAVLVAGTYLGALSHALTALKALQSAGVPLEYIIISESAESALPPEETQESIQLFAGAEIPIYTLPRLPEGPRGYEHAPRLMHPWLSSPQRKYRT